MRYHVLSDKAYIYVLQFCRIEQVVRFIWDVYSLYNITTVNVSGDPSSCFTNISLFIYLPLTMIANKHTQLQCTEFHLTYTAVSR